MDLDCVRSRYRQVVLDVLGLPEVFIIVLIARLVRSFEVTTFAIDNVDQLMR